jgi:polyisoprenoid-binding protein YceI
MAEILELWYIRIYLYNLCPDMRLAFMAHSTRRALQLAALLLSMSLAGQSYSGGGPDACDPSEHLPAKGQVVAADVAGRYRLDAQGSKLEFCVDHFPFSTVRGTFLKYDGGFTIPPHSLEDTQVSVVIWPESAATGTPSIDELLVGERFFAVALYPEIRFKSTDIELKDNGSATLSGDLTLRGVTKPVSFDVEYAFAPFDPKSSERRVSFAATVVISRSEFGMDQLSAVVDDAVKICLTVEASREQHG